MYLILKLTAVILILYLRLNGLNAIPLIDRHKSSLSVVTQLAPIKLTANTTDKNHSSSNESSSSVSKQNIDSKLTETMAILQQNMPDMAAASNRDDDSTLHKDKPQQPIQGALTTHDNAITDLDLNNKTMSNKSDKYFYYDLSSSNGAGHVMPNDEAAVQPLIMPVNVIMLPTTPQFMNAPVTVNVTTLPATLRPIDGLPDIVDNINESGTESVDVDDDDNVDDDVNNNDDDDVDDSDDADVNLGNILKGTINSTDVDRFLLKYDSDNGNMCLLDVIKDNLMWWSNKNGTLRGETIFNLTTHNSYLDLSFRNITQDDNLYGRTKAYTFRNGKGIIAFSAAQNNLTHAPYRTLSLMNDTLKYLTLKGNQFAAYTTEMQKDAINRIINDTNRHPDTSANSTCELNGITTLSYDQSEENDTTTIPPQPDCNITISESSQHHAEGNQNNHRSNRRKYKKYQNKLLGITDEGIAWATFPPMPALTELDISNCHIEFVSRDAFRNLTNLRRLFVAHNKMLTIPHDTFQYVPHLQYLDLSFTNVLDSDYQIPLPTLEAIINLIYGVKIQQMTFRNLSELVYLDLSHTKLTRNSAVAFTHLGEKLRYMSLCYTAFPMVGNALFKNTALVGLDLSGNPYAAYNIIEDAFEGVSDTLKYLYFESSNIKDLAWLRYLSSLRVLGLSGNNINSVSLETFSPLSGLQMLDLSSNHIGNWYNRAFTHNEQLRVLNLRDNNINIITSEMLRDFQLLDYLSLGDNNFVCDCLLRDLVDIAAANNKDAECSRNVLQEAQEIITDNAYLVDEYLSPNMTALVTQGYVALQGSAKRNGGGEATIALNMPQLLMQRYMPALRQSYATMKRDNPRLKIRFVSRFYRALKSDTTTSPQCPDAEPSLVYDKVNSSTLKFQLLDYEDEHYWCFNETERLHFMELNCQPRNYVEDITRKLHTLTKYVVGSVCSILGVSLLGVLIYLKRWHIHYYFSYLKSAALVSVAAKETADQFNALADTDPNLVYDIFISYCQNDRQWVLEELLPNVEETGDVSICMHERDFQIGLTILDNIVSCMDRSRALMLIISSNFLLSHWCQFEMHLAQHRIFEVSKEHLIIVFLEDIPRNKRPKTLQYLMEVKTYIKWPSAGKIGDKTPTADERKFFWKRLKRSLENIGLHSNAHTGESHA